MIQGDRSRFAIESVITTAYEQLGFRALGSFTIHVSGLRYGDPAPDSTMLACSYGEVERRIQHRGEHTAPFAERSDGFLIARAVEDIVYAGTSDENIFGIPVAEVSAWIDAHHLLWAPDGDEAFSDGSRIIQFDTDRGVRLIAYKVVEGGLIDPDTLRDLSLPADEFYGALARFRDAFNAEWLASPKAQP